MHLDLGDVKIVRGELDSALLRAGEAHKFLAVRTMGTANDTVNVSWLDSPTSPDRHRWARPLSAAAPYGTSGVLAGSNRLGEPTDDRCIYEVTGAEAEVGARPEQTGM